MSTAWRAEWAVALARRRLLVMNVLIPLLLVGPLALADPPAAHEAAVLAVLFVLFGTFGSAIPLVRDGGSGLLMRFVHAGASERGYLTGRLAATSLLDLLQLLPALVVVLAAAEAPGTAWPPAAAWLLTALLVANAAGAWAAAAARSLAEAALFAAVVALLLLHAAGVFRTPAAGSLGATGERWSPFRLLHESLLGTGRGGGSVEDPWPAVVTAAGALLVTCLSARFLMRRLARTEE